MTKDIDMKKLQKDAEEIFHSGFACSESVLYAIRKNFEVDIPDDAIAMSSGFPWGLGVNGGCICGALAGGCMCLGYFFGRRSPGEDNQKMLELSGELHNHFKSRNKSTCCRVLTKGKEKNSPERKAQCTDFVQDTTVKVAEILIREL
ncbi:C_GCAxxG_C_C family probable redox protein [Aequitasia blattaphilus]|uniref:C-GCAxxG-C-C family protein n=1 Tax=Aequitasia blattaphilus TaxID=2949332 RepID=A0ABT1EBA7_9FIRM|nr:C-GCAxxG-C-C family (seleno)protein [Aequitasia blattaphilus]MCP1103098.1 C-GCAxxG-C-C family protein [Aequitasia blattaphilus]MCR8615738.1 C-GCAxxG-C-C family protein [Aequitasia blattaphilus]